MKEDVLNGFTRETIDLNDDYEGKACAVLVSKKAKSYTKKAVLYIHGFADYFFNDILADVYNNEGYNFYALDLRKYGRSLMDHQHPNFCKDMSEYFEEMDMTLIFLSLNWGIHIRILLSPSQSTKSLHKLMPQ